MRVGVAYGSDPERVIELLTQAARSHARVLRQPEPNALFIGFGESSLDFVLRYWTLLAAHAEVNSDLHRAIYRCLTGAGIEIPFPQRDVYVHTLPTGMQKEGPLAG